MKPQSCNVKVLDLATVPQQPASFVLLQVFFFISCELSVFFNSKLSVLESSTGKEHGK